MRRRRGRVNSGNARPSTQRSGRIAVINYFVHFRQLLFNNSMIDMNRPPPSGAACSLFLCSETHNQESLLTAWLLNESPYHWGQSPTLPYRMIEGGYDEEGSMSFNQVLYRYRYSDNPCTVHERVGLNYFDPSENLQGFAIHTSGRATGVAQPCGTSFWFAFVSTGRGTARIQGDETLVGYRHGDGPVIPITTNANRRQECNGSNPPVGCEGDYERLAKAIGEYNGATTILRGWPGNGDADHVLPQGLSWPEILKHSTRPSEIKNSHESGECYSCAYSIKVRNEAFGLTPRAYIWHGGTYDDEMPLLTEDGTPQLDENGELILAPRAGQDWCFAFGEREWMGGEA